MVNLSRKPNGSNDASFNTMNGMNDGVIVARHFAAGSVTGPAISSYSDSRNNNGTTLNETSSLLQSGWAGGAAGSTTGSVSFAVTFPVAYTNAPPIVVAVSGGDQTSGTVAYGNGSNTVQGQVFAKAVSITKTGCTIFVFSPTSNWIASNIIYAQWIAIGS